jgi:hypothetical protein
MGPLGVPELIIIAIVLGAPIVVIVLVVWLIVRKAKNSASSPTQAAAQYHQPQPWYPQGGITDEISRLAVLKDRGILTEEEFQEKKRELLSRI